MAGKKVDGHRPPFIDSDLYKVMEGAAYLAKLKDDPELEAQFTELLTSLLRLRTDSYLYPSIQLVSVVKST